MRKVLFFKWHHHHAFLQMKSSSSCHSGQNFQADSAPIRFLKLTKSSDDVIFGLANESCKVWWSAVLFPDNMWTFELLARNSGVKYNMIPEFQDFFSLQMFLSWYQLVCVLTRLTISARANVATVEYALIAQIAKNGMELFRFFVQYLVVPWRAVAG
jgi:hypothetical protein